MLKSMLDMEKEHQKTLTSLRQDGNLESVFDTADELKLKPENFFQEVHFPDEMNFIDFLSMVILQQEEFIKLFDCLGNRTSNKEIQYLLASLGEDAKKQRLWALDRYELEILTL